MHWMPQSGDHKLATKLHKQLVEEGYTCDFAGGNAAHDVVYNYKLGRKSAYLVVRSNGPHRKGRLLQPNAGT